MPLSFRRSFRRLPSTDLSKKKHRPTRAAGGKRVRSSEEFRPTKYPLIIPIGCGAAIGLCLFALFSRGLVSLPAAPTAIPVDYAGIETSAFETALAAQISTVEAQQPTEQTAVAPTPTSAAVTTLPPAALAPSNAWAVDIPDAACIPPDLPQTGRVVEVVNGDTIKVLLDEDGRVYSVHYIGVAAPRVNGENSGLGLQATARNTELTYRKQAILVRDIRDTDANGTLLRYVMIERVFLNYQLVSEGLAKADAAAPDTACLMALQAAEQRARASGLGLWEAEESITATP